MAQPRRQRSGADIQQLPSQSGAALVSPYFHEARNEIVRPDQAVHVSRYFTKNWAHRLGPTGTSIVLCMRELAGDIRTGEAAIQVSQAHIAATVGCSVRTFQREVNDNAVLRLFVRAEERYVRGEAGHVRQVESIYLVSMDDPLAPGDEEKLAEIVARRESARRPAGKVILSHKDVAATVVRQIDGQPQEGVVRQTDVLRLPTLSANLSHENPAATECRSVSESENPTNRIDSVTRPYGPAAETHLAVNSSFLDEWRRTNEDLARHSAKELEDSNSVGYHIQVWNHARKHDRSRGSNQVLTEGVFSILRDLTLRRQSTGQPQGRAFTRRTQKWFEDNGIPMSKNPSTFDPAELEEVRRAIADAPFMRHAKDEARSDQ